MNFWWVNHNQTFRHEFGGGYIWSPNENVNGRRNPFYEFMMRVLPGDGIFSFSDTNIQGIGIALSHCYRATRPREFGAVGRVWNEAGRRVDVRFFEFPNKIRPKDHMRVLNPVLPHRYSPLQSNGNGNQGVYLTVVPRALAEVLAGLIGPEAEHVVRTGIREGLELVSETLYETELKGVQEWETTELEKIFGENIPETERDALVKARVGQGRFKANVAKIERQCRITRVHNPAHLVASHIKPWRESQNDERLCAGNGLLLTPTIDHLFDRGFITFDDSGETLISPVADPDSLMKMGIDHERRPNVGRFTEEQRHFLEHHRKFVFLNPSASVIAVA